jgi:hypothetical protein
MTSEMLDPLGKYTTSEMPDLLKILNLGKFKSELEF